jgi:hypothetical protein
MINEISSGILLIRNVYTSLHFISLCSEIISEDVIAFHVMEFASSLRNIQMTLTQILLHFLPIYTSI